MVQKLPARRRRTVVDDLSEPADTSVLDLLDHVLNKGIVASGDVTLGVAGVDLIYLRLSSVLCAADRVMPAAPRLPARSSRRRRRSRR